MTHLPTGLSREDIERSTVIVPDLQNIQPGDLLVNGVDNNSNIAIVIDSGYTENDTTFDMAKVLVLSVTKEDGRVALNYWGNSGTLSSFTQEPKNYIVRRLIRVKGDVKDNFVLTAFTEELENNDNWDPIIPSREPLSAQLNLTSGTNNSRWIPNTGELYEVNSILFGTEDANVFTESEDYNNSDVIISAPTDMNYDTTGAADNNSTTGNNILVNKGDGFAFYAVNNYTDTDNTFYYDAIKLATFHINISSTNQYDRYTVEYNDKIFNDDGFCKAGYSLKYEESLGLVFKFGFINRFQRFAIRPLQTNIRPGDDLLLNFDVYKDNQLIPVHTREQDYIAVYDEKMLWRANLYIDDGGGDWNNNNPWNASPITSEVNVYGEIEDNDIIKRFLEPITSEITPDIKFYYNSTNFKVSTDKDRVWYGANEWNRIYNFEKLVDEYHNNQTGFDLNISTNNNKLEKGNGKQSIISINSSTWSYNNSNGVAQTGKVSYDWNGQDGPFEFNFKTDNQRKLLEQYYKKSGTFLGVEFGTNFIPPDPLPESPWNSSNAPGTNQSNYIHSSTAYSLGGTNSAGTNQNTLDDQFISILGESYTIESKKYFSYLPSLSNNISKQFAEPPSDRHAPNTISAGYTAGTDCLGFVKNSASYDDNKYGEGIYSWGNITSRMWGDSRINSLYPYYDKLSYLITKKSDRTIIGTDSFGKPIYKYIPESV